MALLVAAVSPGSQSDESQQLFLASLPDEENLLHIQTLPGLPLEILKLDRREWEISMAPPNQVQGLQHSENQTVEIG